MLNSIEDIIDLHENKGNIEDAYIDMHFDEKILKLNTFTLHFSKVNAEREETKKWNARLDFEIRKNSKLYKEIKEFRILFEALDKLKVKSGYIEKRERPDFIIEKDGLKTGIEITRIYSGNDWAKEKLYEDIRTYKIPKKEIEGYIEYKKFNNKIKTYTVKENLVIKTFNKNEDAKILKIKMKNKIFEKIRKMFDEYENYDRNIVLANIVSSQYFENINDIASFNNELSYYINHLEENFNEKEYILLMKLDKKWIKFDLKNHSCDIL